MNYSWGTEERGAGRGRANWKSAAQQVGNLRAHVNTSQESRRNFLGKAARYVGLGLAAPLVKGASNAAEGKVMTVLGPVPAENLGITLSHEHCVVDFIGAEKTTALRHDSEEAFATILPHLKELKAQGCRTLVECTPKYIGRDVRLLERLSKATGLHILTNTGYYGAASNKFLPKHAFTESIDAISKRWVLEWAPVGIDRTGIRPGFMKLGVGKGKLPEVHEKLLRAAARVHLYIGLTIAVHTGDGEAALDEIRILGEEGVSPNGLIWVHAQNGSAETQIEAAKQGAWISLDGYNVKNHSRYVEMLSRFRKEKLWDRVLVSHDHFWSVEGEGERGKLKLSAGGDQVPYQSIFTKLLPELRGNGFDEEEIEQLMVKNPAGAFTVRVRKG